MRTLASLRRVLLPVLALFLSGCVRNGTPTALEMALTNRIGAPQILVGRQLADWMKALGEPSIINQNDRGNTFFYWPQHGVAAFCHPLFQKQYQHQKRDDWVVTSILVPLTNSIPPLLPPVDKDVRITFTKVLFTPSEVSKAKWDAPPYIPHRRNGVTEAVEIRKPDSLLGDYD